MTEQELLPDPGFEGDLSNWASSDDLVVTLGPDDVAVYSGAQAMRLDFIGPGQAAAEMTVYGLEINRNYRISTWMFCPQGSENIAPSIRVHWDDIWATAPATWEDHPEVWSQYAQEVVASTAPFEAGVWVRREVVFAAIRDFVHVQFFNTVDAVVGQSFNVDEASVAINVPREPDVYCELASEWTTIPVMNVVGEDFADAMASYQEVDHYEPDKITPIDPATYAGILSDYTSYASIISTATMVTRVVRIDPGGTESDLQYTMPIPIEHGGFRLIDIEAPLNVFFHYDVTFDNAKVMSTELCYIPSSTITAYEEMQCSPVLLSDPLIASQSMWVGLHSIDALSHPGRRELFDVISRKYPVGISDLRSTPRTTIRVLTLTLEQRTDFLTLVGSGRVLLMRIPDPSYPEAYWYISIGDISEERVIAFDHRKPQRRWVMEVAVVERPHGLVSFESNRVYNDVLNFEPDGTTPITPQSYQGILLDYDDYTSVLTGVDPQLVVPGSGGLLPPPSPVDSPGTWVLVR